MEYNEYKNTLLCAAETLNERLGTPAETHGFCTSFAACFARWRKTGYTFIALRSVFDGICIGNQKAYSSGVPDKTSKAVLLGRGDTAP